MRDLVARLQQGDARAAARLISFCEQGLERAAEVAALVYPLTGKALVVGVTGAPGTGKSTLVDRLIEAYRAQRKTVGVVAVDPTSPFTGGAILGDRVRMQARATDPGVFIRSMATRGHLGGLSRAAHDAVRVLDAMGKDVVLVETVGVGQGEVDVVRTTDTVVVVTAPGLGDEMQAIKAGIMEIGDVFVVNKSDREGADRSAAELESALRMGEEVAASRGRGPGGPAPWKPAVVRASAEKGQGVAELVQAVELHAAWARSTGALAERRRAAREAEILEILKARLVRYVVDEDRLGGAFRAAVERVERKALDPYAAARELLDGLDGLGAR
ncbi:MAG TPA: methylmalonyl Co-A mutase-associated GTPase MeaB [Candidatus Thermoplasmatota archaeon]|jgi:LAO/AO transport system kinase|nr:methylmalonyl Co-A mutase-associated GTPase MeaB [Candidatus Thermoplasmatota archaeon]